MTVGQEMDFTDFSLLASQVEEGKDFCWILKVKQIKIVQSVWDRVYYF